ncbi:MAG: EamA family transporter, partial [Candidatus Binatia bacterium]
MPEPTNRLKGVLCMVGAGLCWSTGGILVRSVTITDAWEIVFWRAIFMAAFIGVFLTVRHRHRTMAQVKAVGLPGVVAGAL